MFSFLVSSLTQKSIDEEGFRMFSVVPSSYLCHHNCKSPILCSTIRWNTWKCRKPGCAVCFTAVWRKCIHNVLKGSTCDCRWRFVLPTKLQWRIIYLLRSLFLTIIIWFSGRLPDRMVSQKRGVERILLLAMKLVILVGKFLTFWCHPDIWLRCWWK